MSLTFADDIVQPRVKNSLSEGMVTFEELKAGNFRFTSGTMGHVRHDKQHRKSLIHGQNPGTILISCSDSRVPPEVIFNQGLGDLFTIRLAGQIVDSSVIASVEYAVQNLNAHLIVVLGHESCGAVKAALTVPIGQSAGSPDLDQLIAAIRPNIVKYLGKRNVGRKIREPVKANVTATVRQLLARSKIIKASVEKGSLLIVSGIYSLAHGNVDFWNTE